MTMTADPPAEAADRTEVEHWEGHRTMSAETVLP